VALPTAFDGLSDDQVKDRLTRVTKDLVEASAKDRPDLERVRDELRRELVRRLPPPNQEAVLTSDDIPPDDGGRTSAVREPQRPSPGGSAASAEVEAGDLL
jgi:hypothetical protein